jgi:hypothetical protein
MCLDNLSVSTKARGLWPEAVSPLPDLNDRPRRQ